MKRLILVTGSSRGIGAAIALELATRYASDAHFVLMARDARKLADVKAQITATTRNTVSTVTCDFAEHHALAYYVNLLQESLFCEFALRDVQQLIAVYNHGTLVFGTVGQIAAAEQPNLLTTFETNLFSVWNIVAALGVLVPLSSVSNQLHVNMSSAYAHEATAEWTGHCATRAARDILFRCLALEQPQLRVLNFLPGLVLTDMTTQAVDVSNEIQQDVTAGKYALPQEVASQLVNILEENTFTSGSHFKFKK